MAEKVSEDQVANLLAILRTDATIDAKVSQINNVKSGIKQNNIPDPCVISLFEAARISMSSQHAALVSAGFSTLNHLLTRLSRQEPKYVVKEAARTLPLVIEKMGDQKEKYRQLAAICLTTFWKASPLDVERIVKNVGLVGKNPRMKIASMNWIVQMHQEQGMPFKSYVSTLMELLEDADGMVRDTARETVIELFQNAPNGAKSDLKKQLKTFNVRPTIVAAITPYLGPTGASGTAEPEPEAARAAPRSLAQSVSAHSNTRPPTPVAEAKAEYVDPAYVNTTRELEDTFREMHPFFEGKESEANWLKREQSCTKLRRLNAGNAPTDYREVFLVEVKSLLDGILKAVNSLRTSLSKEGCSVVQEIAKNVGPGLDPMVEILLQNLIKLCGGTKKISSQNGNVTVDIIIGKVTYSLRIMQHIWMACQDKNVQPRTYATGWLKTLLKKEQHHKGHLEHTGSLELIEKCIKKGLADPNPGVRENMRSTYWAFAPMWPAKADAIRDALDTTHQRLLDNSPDNPHSPKKPAAVVARPGLGFSKSTNVAPKPSLRETMLAQKKAAMATKNLPARPGSAMSAFSSPIKVPTVSSSASKNMGSDGASKGRPDGPVSHGGLSVAPMRPARFKRPEIAPRPATAGPYSVRRPGNTGSSESTTTSPSATRNANARTPSVTSATPRRAVGRPTTSHSNHSTSHNGPASPARSLIEKMPASPRISSPKAKAPRVETSPTRDEELTMVIPKMRGSKEAPPVVTTQVVESSDEELKTDHQSLKVFEDPISGNDYQTMPRPALDAPVLEEVPVNEDATALGRKDANEVSKMPPMSPEKFKQNSRLLDSGIAKIKTKSLDVHGFRKLQGIIRENKAAFTDDRFGTLLDGLFEYLEVSPETLSSEKTQDVKAQILATIKLMHKKDREAFRPHVAKGLASVLATRSYYDSRAHVVAGLEVLANELVALADPGQTADSLTSRLLREEMTTEGCRTISMGLYVLRELLEREFRPTDEEAEDIAKLCSKCLESSDSGVRFDAVQLCVGMHARVGDARFWSLLGEGVKDDPKSLITYYIVKREREMASV